MFGLECVCHLPEFSDSTHRSFLTQLSSFSDSRSHCFRLPFTTQCGCFRHLPHSGRDCWLGCLIDCCLTAFFVVSRCGPKSAACHDHVLLMVSVFSDSCRCWRTSTSKPARSPIAETCWLVVAPWHETPSTSPHNLC